MVNMDPKRKFLIYCSVVEDGISRTQTARNFECSARTVGRIFKEGVSVENDEGVLGVIFHKLGLIVLPKNKFSDIKCSDAIDLLLDECSLSDIDVHDDLTVGDLLNSVEVVSIMDDQEEDDPAFCSHEEDDEECCVADEEEIQEVEYSMVATNQSITVTAVSSDGVDSQTISSSSPSFRKSWTLLREVDIEDEAAFQDVCEEIYIMAQPVKAIEYYSQGLLEIDVVSGVISYQGEPIHNNLTSRIIQGISEKGVDAVKSVINFLEKLMENPSYRAVNSLYDFLSHNDIEIAENGNFYAWKKISDDYTDVRTGTIDNSVGQTPKMPRWKVEEDPEKTCSSGLHVCAKHYLNCFGGSRTVKCEVHPKDVVAIPIDYNNSKMRVCEYRVVEEV